MRIPYCLSSLFFFSIFRLSVCAVSLAAESVDALGDSSANLLAKIAALETENEELKNALREQQGKGEYAAERY